MEIISGKEYIQNNSLPEIISINQLCSFLEISRSRYYQLLDEGILLPPIYSLETKRPYYTRQMAQSNIDVKKNNVGINGKICIFYRSRSRIISSPARKHSQKSKKDNVVSSHVEDICEGLISLGIHDVSPSHVGKIIGKCFPGGVENVDEGEILKAVFCQIKVENNEHNQRA